MSFLELSEERYSCRSLTNKPIEEEKIQAIIRTAVNAPTAVNYQPFKVWVIESPEALALAKSTCTQPFIQPAPVIFVIGGDPSKAWVRRYDGKNFVDVDAGIIATQMMLEIQDLGLGTTWVGGFDPAQMKAHFPEMEGYELIAMFPVGVPSEDAQPGSAHTRYKPEEELVVRI
ncbi:MAG: nitroreductase family protein [Solobacterium sp.]|nr:nitroreductase family protein [Solobacterium sp.]